MYRHEHDGSDRDLLITATAPITDRQLTAPALQTALLALLDEHDRTIAAGLPPAGHPARPWRRRIAWAGIGAVMAFGGVGTAAAATGRPSGVPVLADELRAAAEHSSDVRADVLDLRAAIRGPCPNRTARSCCSATGRDSTPPRLARCSRCRRPPYAPGSYGPAATSERRPAPRRPPDDEPYPCAARCRHRRPSHRVRGDPSSVTRRRSAPARRSSPCPGALPALP